MSDEYLVIDQNGSLHKIVGSVPFLAGWCTQHGGPDWRQALRVFRLDAPLDNDSIAPRPPRPIFVTDDHLKLLDELRESGLTHVGRAPAYLTRRFGLSHEHALATIDYWRATFDDRHSPEGL